MPSNVLTLVLPNFDDILNNPINQSLMPYGLKTILRKSKYIINTDDYNANLMSLFAPESQSESDFPMGFIRNSSNETICIDPCHLHPDRDQLRLFHQGLNVSMDEAKELVSAIQYLFIDIGASVAIDTPNQWSLKLKNRPKVSFTALNQIDGGVITEALPRGTDDKIWIRLLNEIQMVLFEHPVNQQREARGELPVNAVWFWGNGKMPEQWHKWPHVSGDDDLVHSLAMHSQSSYAHDVETYQQIDSKYALHVLPFNPEANLDLQLAILDEWWFKPVYLALKRFRLSRLNLIVSGVGEYRLTPLSAWRFWR